MIDAPWKQRTDAMLQEWSRRQAPSEARLGALEERITEGLAEGLATVSVATVGVEAAAGRPASRRRPLVWCTAAAAVIAAACWVYSSPRDERRVAEPVAAAEFPAVEHTGAELAAQERLLAEADRLFDARLTWLAEEGSEVEIGLAEERSIARDTSLAVAIRLVVVRRREHEKAWDAVRAINVIARSEAAVEWSDDQQGLFLWAYVLPDGTIAVDADMAVTTRGTLRATTSGIFAPGVPAMVASRHVNGAEYRIFQVASLLKAVNG